MPKTATKKIAKFTDSLGGEHIYPTSRDEAIAGKYGIFYADDEFAHACQECGPGSKYYYTSDTSYCVTHMQERILTEYNQLYRDKAVIIDPTRAKAAGHSYYRSARLCPGKPHQKHPEFRTGACHLCKTEHLVDARAIAKDKGLDWYSPPRKCDKCGSRAKRRVADDLCSGCYPTADNRYFRIQARREGLTRYEHPVPCQDCGSRDRDVQTDRCLGCNPRGTRRGPRKVAWSDIQQAPDVSREDARELGFKYYKGSPCRRGHHVARYTSTGGCVECHNPGISTPPAPTPKHSIAPAPPSVINNV